jgi:hypothetical protein
VEYLNTPQTAKGTRKKQNKTKTKKKMKKKSSRGKEFCNRTPAVRSMLEDHAISLFHAIEDRPYSSLSQIGRDALEPKASALTSWTACNFDQCCEAGKL